MAAKQVTVAQNGTLAVMPDALGHAVVAVERP